MASTKRGDIKTNIGGHPDLATGRSTMARGGQGIPAVVQITHRDQRHNNRKTKTTTWQTHHGHSDGRGVSTLGNQSNKQMQIIPASNANIGHCNGIRIETATNSFGLPANSTVAKYITMATTEVSWQQELGIVEKTNENHRRHRNTEITDTRNKVATQRQ